MTLRSTRAAAASAAIVGLIAPALGATPASAQAIGVSQATGSLAHKPSPLVPAAKVAPKASPVEATYQVQRGDSFWSIARKFNVDMHALVSHNGLSTSTIIHPGQVLKVPAPATSAPAAPVPAAPVATATHKVASGETLSAIARKYSTTTSTLASLNSLANPNRIYVGQVLKVAGSAPTPSTPAKPAPAPEVKAATHKVAAGETLSGIARKYSTSVSAIASLNGITNPSRIFVGQVLKVSAGASTPAATTPSAPSKDRLVPDTFLGRTYPEAVVNAANQNKALLNSIDVPSRAQIQQIVRSKAIEMGVDPSLALAVAFQESSFNHRSVSPANAIGTMQVIPSSGQWASQLVGRKLNLIDPHDNATAGVAILRQLLRSAPSVDHAIAGYYQGLGSVNRNGMFADTKVYVQRIKGHQAKFR